MAHIKISNFKYANSMATVFLDVRKQLFLLFFSQNQTWENNILWKKEGGSPESRASGLLE